MKTVLIYDQLGQDAIKFLVVEGDYRHLQGKYANSTVTSEKDEEMIMSLVMDEDGYLLKGFTTEFPVDAVKEGAYVVTIGFLP